MGHFRTLGNLLCPNSLCCSLFGHFLSGPTWIPGCSCEWSSLLLTLVIQPPFYLFSPPLSPLWAKLSYEMLWALVRDTQYWIESHHFNQLDFLESFLQDLQSNRDLLIVLSIIFIAADIFIFPFFFNKFSSTEKEKKKVGVWIYYLFWWVQMATGGKKLALLIQMKFLY